MLLAWVLRFRGTPPTVMVALAWIVSVPVPPVSRVVDRAGAHPIRHGAGADRAHVRATRQHAPIARRPIRTRHEPAAVTLVLLDRARHRVRRPHLVRRRRRRERDVRVHPGLAHVHPIAMGIRAACLGAAVQGHAADRDGRARMDRVRARPTRIGVVDRAGAHTIRHGAGADRAHVRATRQHAPIARRPIRTRHEPAAVTLVLLDRARHRVRRPHLIRRRRRRERDVRVHPGLAHVHPIAMGIRAACLGAAVQGHAADRDGRARMDRVRARPTRIGVVDRAGAHTIRHGAGADRAHVRATRQHAPIARRPIRTRHEPAAVTLVLLDRARHRVRRPHLIRRRRRRERDVRVHPGLAYVGPIVRNIGASGQGTAGQADPTNQERCDRMDRVRARPTCIGVCDRATPPRRRAATDRTRVWATCQHAPCARRPIRRRHKPVTVTNVLVDRAGHRMRRPHLIRRRRRRERDVRVNDRPVAGGSGSTLIGRDGDVDCPDAEHVGTSSEAGEILTRDARDERACACAAAAGDVALELDPGRGGSVIEIERDAARLSRGRRRCSDRRYGRRCRLTGRARGAVDDQVGDNRARVAVAGVITVYRHQLARLTGTGGGAVGPAEVLLVAPGALVGVLRRGLVDQVLVSCYCRSGRTARRPLPRPNGTRPWGLGRSLPPTPTGPYWFWVSEMPAGGGSLGLQLVSG